MKNRDVIGRLAKERRKDSTDKRGVHMIAFYSPAIYCNTDVTHY